MNAREGSPTASAPSQTKSTSAELLVLGLLAQRDRHGYELKRILDQQVQPLLDVGPGTLYYTLQRLEARDRIVPIFTGRVRGRPKRTTYQITTAGRAYLGELLDRTLRDLACPVQIPLALIFMGAIDPGEFLQALQHRRAVLQRTCEDLQKTFAGRDGQTEFPMRWLARYSEQYCRMELEWLDRFGLELAARHNLTYETTSTPTTQEAVSCALILGLLNIGDGDGVGSIGDWCT